MTQPTLALFISRSRRRLVLGGLSGLTSLVGLAVWPDEALALSPKTLVFPRDRGAHPEFRTEWWYITGYAVSPTPELRTFGFQLTFFRSRIDGTEGMKSKFAARQLIFAHAAITDVQGKKLWHDQRIARAGFGIAAASEQDMAITLRDWSLKAEGSTYTAELLASDFALRLQFKETQAVLLQGNQGLSRKGPDEKQASYYYSQPHLATQGNLQVKGQTYAVSGKAWLDHEWSNELLHPSAVGWDWIGMNLDDGGALTAFRLRDKDGKAVWAGGSLRSGTGNLRVFDADEVIFQPVRSWTSPLTKITYPVEWTIRTPSATYSVKAIIDNQELDSRSTTGSVYWEGLSELADGQSRRVGMGYLELTGYGEPLRM